LQATKADIASLVALNDIPMVIVLALVEAEVVELMLDVDDVHHYFEQVHILVDDL
jgi:hypothetical protein